MIFTYLVTYLRVSDELREVSVCHSDYFRAKCAWDELIVVAHARYGRMRINKCVLENFGYVGCYVDVLDVLHARCTGRSRCALDVVEPTFGHRRPCNVELNNYLEVDHQCLPGQSVHIIDRQSRFYKFYFLNS